MQRNKIYSLILFLITILLIYSCSDSLDIPPEELDSPPRITNFSANKTKIMPQDTISLTCKASDSDQEDILTIQWQSDVGEFLESEEVDSNNTFYKNWVAPAEEGAIEIKSIVSDGILEVERKIIISVQENPNLPSSPVNPIPSDGSKDEDAFIKLEWELLGNESNVFFDVYLDTLENPALVDTNLEQYFYEVELASGKDYYWKIVAKYDDSTFTTGDVWSFSTKKEITGGDASKFDFLNVPAGIFTRDSLDIIDSLDYSFGITKYEITNSDYLEFLNVTKQDTSFRVIANTLYGYYKGDLNYNPGDYPLMKFDNESKIQFQNEEYSVVSGYENHPVTNVTWFGAKLFALYYDCDLPTAKEWEKSARDTTGFEYPWGDDITPQNANYDDENDTWGLDTTPIGNFNGSNSTVDSKSPLGAYDMCGNAAEWSSTEHGNGFLVCGGAFNMDKRFVKSWWYYSYNPEAGLPYVGFRIVKR